MKVVMVSDYSPQPYGGLQTHVYHLAKNMAKNDVETHILTISDRNEDLIIEGVNVHLVKRPLKIPRLFTILLDVRVLEKKIFDIDPDVVHVHGSYYPYNMVVPKIANKYPLVLTIHGLMQIEYKFNRGLNFLGAIVSLILERYTLNRTKTIITVAPQIADAIKRITDSEVHVLPNGVNFKYIKGLNALKRKKPNYVLFIGLLEEIKGIDVLLKASSIITKSIPNFNLLIVGSGSQENKLKKLSEKLKLEQNVKFLGFISGDKKYSYIKSSEFCVIPSKHESLPIAVLEFMACGKPIIASDVGGIPFLIENGKNGFLVKSNDYKELSDKIIYLLNDKDLIQKMGGYSLKIIEGYGWPKIAKNTYNIYKHVISMEGRS